MTIETKYSIGDKFPLTVDNGSAAMLVTAISVRVNTPEDVRIVYEGTLYQHSHDQNGKLIKWGTNRPYSISEDKIGDNSQTAPAHKTAHLDAEV